MYINKSDLIHVVF